MAEKTKVLITGDSFAAVWPDSKNGWVNLLAKDFDVKNIAQPGISEYKILRQIKSENLKNYDCIIVSHTSPARIHVPEHPLHKEGFHKNCDLIASDIDRVSFFNPALSAAKGWFKYYYDDEYQVDIYNLMRKEINDIINIPYLSISHVDIVSQLSIEDDHIDFSDLWKSNRGPVNHYTTEANKIVYEKIKKEIWKII